MLCCKTKSPRLLLCFYFPSSKGAEIDCEDKNGNTPLHIAARYGHELLINTLITSRADTAKYVSFSAPFFFFYMWSNLRIEHVLVSLVHKCCTMWESCMFQKFQSFVVI